MKKLIITSVCSMTLLPTVNAAIIAGYDFTTNTAATTTDVGVTATNVTGVGGFSNSGIVAIGDNTGVAASGTTFGSVANGSYGDTNANIDANTFAAAIDGIGDDYYTLTVTAVVAGTLNISDFSISTARAGSRAPESYRVLAQVNGGTTFDATADLNGANEVTTVGQGTTDWFDTHIDLSGNTTFQGIDSVEFRVYFFNANGNTSSSRINMDNLLIEGTVVPEPSSTALLGLGGLALILRRRK